ncbi:hypothetical protein [Streptomyces sp. Ac-502]|uniref:hypothetical protein n=1 Tax=Streptomyces sp. Ac-502 TaxID=3342801 RepID=UPI003862A119
MAKTKKVTITLPAELLESMKAHTDNVSGYITELAERAERRRLLREELDRYQGNSVRSPMRRWLRPARSCTEPRGKRSARREH